MLTKQVNKCYNVLEVLELIKL